MKLMRTPLGFSAAQIGIFVWPRKCKDCIVGIETASSHWAELPTSLNKQFYAQLEICAVDYLIVTIGPILAYG